MISDESEEQFSSGYPWRAHAIPALQKLIPGGPLPAGETLDELFVRATTKDPEAVQRLYYGSLYALVGTIVARVGNSWYRANFFLRFLSIYVLDAIVRHDAETDGPLERFLALQTACGFANAAEAWCQRPAPTFQEQVDRTAIQLRLGSTRSDTELIDALYKRTLLSTASIHQGLYVLTCTHVPFDPFDAEEEESAEAWLPGSSNVPDDLVGLAHPDDPNPIMDRDADHVELAGMPDQADELLYGDFASPYAAVGEHTLTELIHRTLATLTPREEKVIRMRFGIGYRSDYNLEEVGQEFEVTRERIRHIEAKALRKLRHPARSRRLRAFVKENVTDDDLPRLFRKPVTDHEQRQVVWNHNHPEPPPALPPKEPTPSAPVVPPVHEVATAEVKILPLPSVAYDRMDSLELWRATIPFYHEERNPMPDPDKPPVSPAQQAAEESLLALKRECEVNLKKAEAAAVPYLKSVKDAKEALKKAERSLRQLQRGY